MENRVLWELRINRFGRFMDYGFGIRKDCIVVGRKVIENVGGGKRVVVYVYLGFFFVVDLLCEELLL